MSLRRVAGMSLLLWVGILSAQHDQHQTPAAGTKPESTATVDQSAAKTEKCPMCETMKKSKAEASDLIGQLLISLDAIEAEKNPEALKGKLAGHRALLKELEKNAGSKVH